MMWVEKVHIYGFGKWHDQWFDFNERLTVVQGPNESGKTSLKQFILYVLFDLPLSRRKSYIPKLGSTFGGRLFINTKEHGTVIVERMMDKRKNQAVCLLEDGSQKKEEFLKTSILNGMNRHTFEQIFSFNDQDLQKLQFVKSEDLGRVLFGIGLSGSDKMTELEKDLTKHMEQLFKKRGKKPIINEQLREIKDLKGKMMERVEKEGRYNELQEEIKKLEKEKMIKEIELEDRRKKLEWVDKHLRVQEAIQQYQQLDQKLQKYKDMGTFPHMGLERHRQLKEWILPLQSDIHALKKRIESKEKTIETMNHQLIHEHAFQALSELDELWNEYQYIERISKEKQSALQASNQSLKHQLSQLGNQPGEITLSDYPLSAFTEDKWGGLAREYEQNMENEDKQKQQEKRLEDEQKNLQAKADDYHSQLLPDDEYKNLKNQIHQHREAEWKEQWIRDQQSMYQNEQKALQKTIRRFQRVGFLSVLAGILSLLSAGMIAYFTENITGYIWGTVLLFLGMMSRLGIGVSIKSLKNRISTIQGNVQTDKYQSLSDHQIQEIEKRIHQHEHILNKWQEWKARLEDNRKELDRCKQDQELINQKLIRLREQIQEERDRYPFLESVEVPYWPSLYFKVTKLQGEETEREKLEADISELAEQKEKLQTRVETIANQCNLKLTKHDHIWQELEELKENEYKKRNKFVRLKEEIQQAQNELQELNDQLDPFVKEQKLLYAKAGVNDEETFIEKGKRFEEKTQLRIKQEEWFYHIRIVFQSEADGIVRQSFHWSEIKQEKHTHEQKIKPLEENIEEHRQRVADLNAELNQLEENEQLSSLRHQFAFQKNELREQVKQWMIYKTADHFLKKTKQIYQNEYLPQVMERATLYFQRLTEGQYLQILPPSDEETFRVESAEHIQYEVSELSSGTTAQAYVSLRLALSEVMNNQYGVPFLIDDAFVHYDRSRKEEMLAIIKEISHRQQVIYFTWNENDFYNQEKIAVSLQTQKISLL
ncbi:ATP-binding protein [Salinibacillus kushneri]|nr:AAA family ATPase [Salinibacillus kushneri]